LEKFEKLGPKNAINSKIGDPLLFYEATRYLCTTSKSHGIPRGQIMSAKEIQKLQ
jgi:hypothetical protein